VSTQLQLNDDDDDDDDDMSRKVPDQIAEGPVLKSDNVLCTVRIMVHCSSANLS
jgi:hypothetical protein